MIVPSLDLKAQYRSIRNELDAKVLEVLGSQGFVLGPEVESLEKELAALHGTGHAVGVSSGSDALLVALMALGIGEGDIVVTTPFTFFATAGAVTRLKARPAFCDIDEKTYNLSPDALGEYLEREVRGMRNSRIKAVIPVHLYGQCADMDAIGALAGEYGLAVVEDACQAVGSEYPSKQGIRKACALGTAGALSFYPTKNLGGIGDGGMVLTNDASLADKVRALRVHGESRRYYYDAIGGNFRLDALQAAALRVKLRHFLEWQNRRLEKAAYYDAAFERSGLTRGGHIAPPAAVYKDSGAVYYHTYHQYVIRARERDGLQAFLKERSVGSAVYYPLGLHMQKCFSDLGYRAGDFPVTEKASREVLALPMYAELTQEQQDFVVSGVTEFYGKA
ncbi:MAG TPA: DegT/DnrJ/EryC1/StrS family aminotransferase [Acidobacteriota bacterium]|nr:DegT/DnrJ/EryC1/StrS family aminotransferase [Acidobacteriota bacterium]